MMIYHEGPNGDNVWLFSVPSVQTNLFREVAKKEFIGGHVAWSKASSIEQDFHVLDRSTCQAFAKD